MFFEMCFIRVFFSVPAEGLVAYCHHCLCVVVEAPVAVVAQVQFFAGLNVEPVVRCVAEWERCAVVVAEPEHYVVVGAQGAAYF